MDLSKVKKILQENNLYAKKQYGQNFLIDKNILNKIVDAANLSPDSTVIEIGPGLGSLTELLIDKCKVVCYEIDDDMVKVLNNRFNDKLNKELYIYHKDFLKANLEKDLKEYSNLKVVANLPYYITTPILLKILEEMNDLDEMIVMMQKEVALRICGKPSTKDYNALSVLVQYKHHASILFDVPKGCFYPEPDVTSSIVKIKRFNQDVLPINEEFFYSFNRNIFKQRRKTFANNVKSSYPVSKEDVENILTNLGYSVTIRSEALDIYDIIKLSDAFYHLLNK